MNHFKKIFALFCLTIVFLVSSCSMDMEEGFSLQAGEDFLSTKIRIYSVDTISIQMSTMKFDSIVTSSSQRLLFGRYEDENLGTIKASSYFEVTPSKYTIEEDAVLDSVGLVLNYDTYFYNDTTRVLNLNVHRVLESFKSYNSAFYNTSKLAFDPIPLSTKSYTPQPNTDSIYIALPNTLGEEFFNKIKNKEIEDSEAFLRFFKGLTLQANSTDNASINGFDVSKTSLNLYYHIPGEEDDEIELDFSINTNSTLSYFNNIQSNVSNKPIESLTDQEEVLLSTSTNNISYLQAGIGYAIRIEIPSLNNLKELSSNNITILNASLEIGIKKSSYSDVKPIDELLNLFIVEQNNNILQQLTTQDGFLQARFIRDDEFKKNIYRVPIYQFVERKFNEKNITEDALILIQENYNSKVNSLLFYDAFNNEFKAKLIVTYGTYED